MAATLVLVLVLLWLLLCRKRSAIAKRRHEEHSQAKLTHHALVDTPSHTSIDDKDLEGRLELHPDLPEAHDLQGWWQSQGKQQQANFKALSVSGAGGGGAGKNSQRIYYREIDEKALGPDHMNVLNTRGNMGMAQMESSDAQTAEAGAGVVRTVLRTLRDTHRLTESHPWIKKFSAALD